MATVMSLPPELLARIIIFTIPNDFEPIMMTCKRFYEAGDIYRVEHNRLAQRYRCFRFGTDIPSSWELLAAIAGEPVIGEYIKTAYLYNDGNWGYADEDGEHSTIANQPPSNTSRRPLIKDLLQRSRYRAAMSLDADEWLESMVNGFGDEPSNRLLSSSVFLLTLLPNITALAPPKIWSDFYYDSDSNKPVADLLCSVVRFANTDASHDASLSKLTDIYPIGLDHGYDERMGLEHLSPLFALPSVRTVSAVSCIASDDGNSGIDITWNTPGLTSPIDTLELYASIMEGPETEKFFENVVNLRSFRFAHETKWHGCGHEWDAEEFFDTLTKCLGPSLKELSVTFTNYFEDLSSCVTSLEGFEQLEELEIDVRLLGIPNEEAGVGKVERRDNARTTADDIPCFADILPRTIKTIQIIAGISEFETTILTRLLTGLRDAAVEKLPDLQTVTVTRGTVSVGSRSCQAEQDAGAWSKVKVVLQDQGYEYREAEDARAAWIPGLFERFPYLDAEYN